MLESEKGKERRALQEFVLVLAEVELLLFPVFGVGLGLGSC